MSKKQESETIRQQKLAREEFIKLKKMQSGEMETEPKPSDVAIVPKTFKEKVINYWYHFGKLTIVSVLIFIFMSVAVVQCINKPKIDLYVIYFTYTPVTDDVTENIGKYLSKYCKDVNNDGESNVTVVNCSCNKNSNNSTVLTKMQAMIAADSNALLFITDDESIKYFDNLKSNNKEFFEKNSIKLSESFYKDADIDIDNLKNTLSLRIRDIGDTLIEKESDSKKYYEASKEIFNAMK